MLKKKMRSLEVTMHNHLNREGRSQARAPHLGR